MIVTNDDRILCEDCYRECLDEQDPSTRYFSTIDTGECQICGNICPICGRVVGKGCDGLCFY